MNHQYTNRVDYGLCGSITDINGWVRVRARDMVNGPAGTGKSTVLRELRRRLMAGGVYEPVVLAPSGVAAVNVSRCTIHQFFESGVDRGKGSMSFSPNLFVYPGLASPYHQGSV